MDKAIQELEEELKRLLPGGQAASPSTLATAVRNTNNRIRLYGLSAREIVLKRDSYTNAGLDFSDSDLSSFKHSKRVENHAHSERSKGRGANAAIDTSVDIGDIVHVKKDGSKHQVRDFYLVVEVDIQQKMSTLQKFCGYQLRNKKYSVKLNEIYKAPCSFTSAQTSPMQKTDPDSDEDIHYTDTEDSSETVPVRSSTRTRRTPDYLVTSEIRRV